jgi:hypothetical protein
MKGEVAMSNINWDEDDELELEDYSNGDDGIKNLRKAKRANEKYIKQLEEKLGEYIAKDYERTVKEVLTNKGVNAKAARLILNDLEEVTEESVTNWLINNGELIGFQPKQESNINEADLQSLAKQDAVTNDAGAPSNSDDIEQRLAQATSEEEIMSILNSVK